MTASSSRILRAIEAFAESMGVTARAASDGSFSFVLAQAGVLTFTPSGSGDRLLVSLAQPRQWPSADAERQLFRRAGFDPTTKKFLHSAMTEDGSFMNVMEFDQNEIDAPTLDQAAQRLIEAQES